MARTNTLGNFLTDVAEAIRTKKGTSETIQASQFDIEIANLPSGSDLDWSAIGYDSTPQAIIDGYDYAVEIQENWDNSLTTLSRKFQYDYNLKFMPLVDTSNATLMTAMFGGCRNLLKLPILDTSSVTGMSSMFENCSGLETIPLLNTESVTNMQNMFGYCEMLKTIPLLNTESVTNMNSMFANCGKLTDESLDNILQMCINATAYTSTKTLYFLGFQSYQYPVSRIEALPHYQDFINAGWTIGY